MPPVGLLLGGATEAFSSLPPIVPHTSVLLPLCIKRSKKPEPVLYSLKFSIFKTVRTAEGLNSVIATEEPRSA